MGVTECSRVDHDHDLYRLPILLRRLSAGTSSFVAGATQISHHITGKE